jgi:FkbM family methyltransferase
MREKLHTGEGDERVYPEWYKALMRGEFDHLLQFTDPTKAAVDVGALLGTYGLTLSSLSTKCLCIEPLKNYAFLANVLPDNCIVRIVAAGDKLGEGVLRTPDWRYGLSSLLDIEWPNAKVITEQMTKIEKLDDIVDEALPDVPIGFVKIDAEGYELHVLRGATELLQKHRPNLQIEIWNLEEVRGLLEELGYRGLFFFDGRLLDIGQLNPEIHQNPDNAWSREKRDEFDPDLWVANIFFIPNR